MSRLKSFKRCLADLWKCWSNKQLETKNINHAVVVISDPKGEYGFVMRLKISSVVISFSCFNKSHSVVVLLSDERDKVPIEGLQSCVYGNLTDTQGKRQSLQALCLSLYVTSIFS